MTHPVSTDDQIRSGLLVGQAPPAVVLSNCFRVDDLVINAPDGLIKPFHLAVLANATYEAAEIALAVALIKPGQRVLEFGGGIGVVSRRIAQITGPGCVLSVEANPQALATALDHLGRDGLGVTHRWGMVVAQATAGKDQGLRVDPQNFLASHPGTTGTTSPSSWQIDCPSLVLSDLMQDWQPQVLVVDIEGAEHGVFDGIDLAHVETVILELHPAVIGVDGCLAVVNALHGHGLMPDPGLVGGAVLAFVRAPSTVAEASLRRLFQSLIQPDTDLTVVAQDFPASPLMDLCALLQPNAPSAGRTERLAVLAQNPMTARIAAWQLAQEALKWGDNDAVLGLTGAAPLTGLESQFAAIALLRLRRLPEALAAASRMVSALPQSAPAQLLYARILAANGNRPAARAAAAQAQALDPATIGLAQFLQDLAKAPN